MNLVLFQKKYKNKKVFLTGHTGFKGSWLLKWLTVLGAEVKGYALEPGNTNDLFNLIYGENICHSVIADIRNKERVEKEILEFKPDYIFHLAAQPLVRLSYKIPSETFEVNAIGTAFVLDAVAKLSNPCTVILITTDKVYENKEWEYPYRESDRLGGYDPYSASKACAELIISSYRNSFFNKNEINQHKKGIAAARAGNVIGGGDWAKDRIIPDMVRSLFKGEDIVVRNPKAVRPWQHVLEPLSGYLQLGALLSDSPKDFSEAWNFGPCAEDNLTVEELVKVGLQVWGKGNFKVPELKDEPHEAGLLKLDISKTSTHLHWRPKLNSREAITLTLEWYKKFYTNPSDIALYTENEINKFMQLNEKF